MARAIARRREGYQHELEIREHRLFADEPSEKGGSDSGPTPTELLAGALASCTAITIEMYADRKGWDLGEVEVSVDYEAKGETPVSFTVQTRVPTELNSEQRDRILTIAGKCPVHKALAAQDVSIEDSLDTGAA